MSQIESRHDLTTKQGVFDLVIEKLVEQGKPAHNGNYCMYSLPDGCRCAAGHLMPADDETIGRMVMPITRAGSGPARMLDPRIPKTDESLDFIRELQRAHDIPATLPVNGGKQIANENWLSEWIARMEQIAENHSLTMPEIAA